MSTMISEVYDAFREAGASEEKSRKAAEAVAAFDTRFHNLERSMDKRFSDLERDMAVLKWMVGFNLAIGIATLWKVFS
jgi:hypothetical protein